MSPQEPKPPSNQLFEPKVVAYCCTYCAYTAGDLAGSMRLEYAPNVRVVKILCSGKVDAVLLLRAFEDGADAVYVAGCAIGDCHFLEGNLRAIQTVAHAKKLMAEIGLEQERLDEYKGELGGTNRCTVWDLDALTVQVALGNPCKADWVSVSDVL